MIRIDTDSYTIVGQKYGLPSQKCAMSAQAALLHGGNIYCFDFWLLVCTSVYRGCKEGVLIDLYPMG